ncbi:MAG: DUF5693 family protein, partial [Symbiobacteriaceae bacterium]|nr:DUF5693 family protein [Symbiobacteriaceae bacterium]
MKLLPKWQLYLILATILSLLPVLYTTNQRVILESRSRRVQYILDSEELWQMVRRLPLAQDSDYHQALEQYAAAGANALAIYPVSFSRMEERGEAASYDGQTFRQHLRAGAWSDLDTSFAEAGVACWYLFIPQGTNADKVEELLADRSELLQWRFFHTATGLLIEVPSIYWPDYRRAGLWYDMAEIDEALALGFDLVLRTAALPGQREEHLAATLEPILASGKVSLILPTGSYLNGVLPISPGVATGVPGVDSSELFYSYFAKYDLTYGLIENINQLNNFRFAGDVDLLQRRDFNAIRVYAIQRAELDKENWLDPSGIIDRWFRAVVDRNIRGIYIRLFSGTNKDPRQIMAQNCEIITASVTQVQGAGYNVGKPVALEPFHLVNQMLLLTASLGLALAWLAILCYSWQRYLWPLLLTGVAVLGCVGVGYLARSGLWWGYSAGWVTMRHLLGLVAHVVYPTLAGMVAVLLLRSLAGQSSSLRSTWLSGLLLALTGLGVTLAGGLVLGMLQSDNLFLLELDSFRGVKVSYTLPIILFALWFFFRFGLSLPEKQVWSGAEPRRTWRQMWQELTLLWATPLNMGLLLVMGGGAVAVWYYLGRSGHEAGVAISQVELALRSFLEQLLVARPRNKEFLIGYPALMLLPWLQQHPRLRFLVLPAGMAAMTGLISVVNSFAHIRTPILISVERSLYGYLLGAI